ncbi:hypothetical protein AWC05_24100 [Mycobacterium florentinum]|uniref:Uncharacterized protein n=2 Tax=Mycobacterium florentinum TaxID=292462 RepID=A0A1X1U6Z6_MYCFL|nr:hypothetical protein AWC05_24100 [Mycobacterium florentinum]BBX79070.1 hypothetical protein MFLOJ_28570 [Mycobacterium florentinum]
MARIRRGLSRPVSVQAVIELALWLALPYLLIGFCWAIVHPDRVRDLQVEWSKVTPIGADLAGFGEAAALWPAVLLLPATCTLPGQ